MKIYLNIYDLAQANYYLHSFGLGIYHTGIQVGSQEYHFGGHEGTSTGVCATEPKEFTSNVIYRETIFMGDCTLSNSQINSIIEDLKRNFPGNSYDVLANNCNHFSNAVCQRLLNKPIPSFVNRAASFGNLMRCCLPNSLIEGPAGDPTKQQSQSSSGNASSSKNTSSTYSFSAFKGSGVSIGGQAKTASTSNKKGYLRQSNDIDI